MNRSQILCPCCHTTPYSDCCEPFHLVKAYPQTAEQLMRSRFSAYFYQLSDYLVATLHKERRTPTTQEEIEENFNKVSWRNLKVMATQKGGEHDNVGIVEFVAFYLVNRDNHATQINNATQLEPQSVDKRSLMQIHERSHFIREEGSWVYVDGEFLPDIKIERNQACPCGSGKKAKKCQHEETN